MKNKEKCKELMIAYCKKNIKRYKGIALVNLSFPEEEQDSLFFQMTLEHFKKEHIKENVVVYFVCENWERMFNDFDDAVDWLGSDLEDCCTAKGIEFDTDVYDDIQEIDVFETELN